MGNLYRLVVLLTAFGINFLHASELCLTGDFEEQFSYILHTEMLTEERMREIVKTCQDVETTLNTLWPGTNVTTFGSLVTGLGMKTSDVDCVAEVPRNNTLPERYIVMQTANLLLQRPDVYQDLSTRPLFRVPLITFYYVPAQIVCDLSFGHVEGIRNTKLMNYYMLLDDRVRSVTAVLKFWSKIHQIYAIELLAVFYFQQRGIVPPVHLLQVRAEPYTINEWNHGFVELPYNSNNTDSMYELLRGFFEYYSEFNFEDYIISPYAGRPIARSLFSDIATVPEEFALYKHNVKKGICNPIRLNSTLGIQDPFEHNINIVARKHPKVPLRLFSQVRIARKAFHELPRDEVLRAVLVKTGPYSLKENVDSVSNRTDCARAA